MHNGVELSLGNVLILMLALAMTWWMSRAPRSFLKLLSVRIPGLDKDRPWLNWIVRWWGRTTFFFVTLGLLAMFTPNGLANSTGVGALTMILSVVISVLALRKPKKEDAYTAALKSTPQAGSSRSV